MSGAEDFPTPPREFTDAGGRGIEVRRAEPDDIDGLCGMYLRFDPGDRAQGIPPVEETQIREWLGDVLAGDTFNVVAWHGERAVGHATLVPDGTGAYELAIFVLREYQGARVGTTMVRTLLGWAGAEGVEHVWLIVERWNEAAIRLYRGVGFEVVDSQSFETEMAVDLPE